MTTLSDRLVAANVRGLSARGLARMARENGHTLNHDTAARYLRGTHGKPQESTLIAFADILDVALADLRRAARLPAEMTEAYVPPPEASRMTIRQRRAVDEVIRAMLAATPTAEHGEATVTELGARPRVRGPRAARHGTPEPPTP